MSSASAALSRSGVHTQWQGILSEALEAVDPDYLSLLLQSDNWLPGIDNLFRAFRRDRQAVRYILIGESPYPRAESANGIAFYDAAVDQLWSESGLSKTVNRATSLRNIIKTALLAEGYIKLDAQGKISQASISEIDKSNLIGTLAELFQAFEKSGFLLINATPVLRPDIKPALEAQYWRGFLARLLCRLTPPTDHPLTLVLWGKIAKTVETLNLPDHYRKLVSEHPYNLSFIENPLMRSLFQELKLLSLNR